MEFETIVKFILILVVVVLVLFFLPKNLYSMAKSLLGLGDEFEVNQEQVKFKAVDTFNELINKLETCANSKIEKCNCFVKEIPEFPVDYKLVLINENKKIKLLLSDKNDIEIISKYFGENIKNLDLCYLSNQFYEHTDKITINFDKKPYYTGEGYKIETDFNPFLKWGTNFLTEFCLVTDKAWKDKPLKVSDIVYIVTTDRRKLSLQEELYANPSCG